MQSLRGTDKLIRGSEAEHKPIDMIYVKSMHKYIRETLSYVFRWRDLISMDQVSKFNSKYIRTLRNRFLEAFNEVLEWLDGRLNSNLKSPFEAAAA